MKLGVGLAVQTVGYLVRRLQEGATDDARGYETVLQGEDVAFDLKNVPGHRLAANSVPSGIHRLDAIDPGCQAPQGSGYL